MARKDRLTSLLNQARGFSEGLLADFKTPADWARQVHPAANNAFWFVGHMTSTDNFVLSVIAPDKVIDLPEYKEKFGMGSKPSGNPADYLPPAEMLAMMRERRQVLLAALDQLSDADLEKPLPEGGPSFLKDWASAFEFLPFHEGIHAGQVTVTRCAMGLKPLMGG